MTIQQKINSQIAMLPAEKQKKVLEFIESLAQKPSAATPAKNLEGALAHLKINLSDKDIEDARGEIWNKFPREISL
jgi:hypothetical protein